jgi:hypothetical protein
MSDMQSLERYDFSRESECNFARPVEERTFVRLYPARASRNTAKLRKAVALVMSILFFLKSRANFIIGYLTETPKKCSMEKETI